MDQLPERACVGCQPWRLVAKLRAVRWASAVCFFFFVHGFCSLSKSPSAAASGGFLLSNSPEYGSLKGKTFWKKIPRERSEQGRFFFKNRRPRS